MGNREVPPSELKTKFVDVNMKDGGCLKKGIPAVFKKTKSDATRKYCVCLWLKFHNNQIRMAY